MAGQLADMVFTDPPYNVDYKGGAARRSNRKIANDDLGTGFGAFLQAACGNMLAVTKGAVYICMSSSELHTLKPAFAAAGGHWSTFVIWAKDRPSRSAAPTTSGSMSRSSTAGAKAPTTSGAARVTRATSGSSTNR